MSREISYITSKWGKTPCTSTVAEAVEHRLSIDEPYETGQLEKLNERVRSLSLIVARMLDHPSMTDSQILTILDFEQPPSM